MAFPSIAHHFLQAKAPFNTRYEKYSVIGARVTYALRAKADAVVTLTTLLYRMNHWGSENYEVNSGKIFNTYTAPASENTLRELLTRTFNE